MRPNLAMVATLWVEDRLSEMSTSLRVEKFEKWKPKERRYLLYAGSLQFKFVPLC